MLSLFLLIKKRDSFLFIKPLKPKKLKETIFYLGASFIKLAQVLATRSDFFSKEYLDELKELHDKLPKMSKADFEKVFKESFKEKCFKKFENEPIASASIGQVHIAFLEDDTKVAVKLRRKNIEKQVRVDIKILNFFNKLFRPLFSYYTKNSIDAVINEFSSMIKDETNLSIELENLKKFSITYENSGILFPKPYEEFCSQSAIVMSFMEGFRFDDKASLKKYDIDFIQIISKLVNFYTEQMLINGYFHADPHPGNLLVNTNGDLILLDYGMVKNIANDSRVAIIELIDGANRGDFETFVRANKKLGTISYEAPEGLMVEFSQKMFDIFSNDNLSSESMQKLAFEVLESTRDLPFKLPSDAVYILRVSAIIEGLGTTYIENFNGVKDILPILKDNLPKALGIKTTISEIVLDELESIPKFLKNLKYMVAKSSKGELEVLLNKDQLEFIKKDLKDYFGSYLKSLSFILFGMFLVFYDENLKNLALLLVSFGFLRVWFIK
ncbi:putative ubiquinone biosynthesis protein kinase [Aliarcobacter cibarius]|uniref:Putative ubiquinone biosynthesis protein kinase n=1 Tax=Aliarcobacter cibarius TaxID=255507 RepID=A0A5J6RJ37_9BACT|nr:AarF/UbiB family protein [Aliarcobacter cibarius]QEZ89397.1 putative ubiquinone biosynthesis protein kinase [Aliarcobacter cibarius]QKJ27396.1 putative ubiquinone biosynthesis protein kinase [Aliarcobacter cibarius]